MRYNKRVIQIVFGGWTTILIGVILCMLLTFTSCKTRYVTQEIPITIHDSIRVVQTERITDTIRETNTISLIDTMWLDTSTVATLGMPILHHNRTTNVSSNKEEKSNKETTDTMYVEIEKPVPYKVEVPISEPLKWWQSTLIWVGGFFILLVIAIIGWFIWRIK